MNNVSKLFPITPEDVTEILPLLFDEEITILNTLSDKIEKDWTDNPSILTAVALVNLLPSIVTLSPPKALSKENEEITGARVMANESVLVAVPDGVVILTKPVVLRLSTTAVMVFIEDDVEIAKLLTFTLFILTADAEAKAYPLIVKVEPIIPTLGLMLIMVGVT